MPATASASCRGVTAFLLEGPLLKGAPEEGQLQAIHIHGLMQLLPCPALLGLALDFCLPFPKSHPVAIVMALTAIDVATALMTHSN